MKLTTPPKNDPRPRFLKVRTHVRAGAAPLPAPIRPRGWNGDIEIGQGI